ncbi:MULTISPECIES: hypothetical protein [unclassified Streptomyces]|uniref:hypothetical protein n=1 Tax=unclassified Streptomyces TaxID=2593676 RepID=UPI0011B0926C|nr:MULTISPECIES: hypothetical protein [unclassified Streptomyces]
MAETEHELRIVKKAAAEGRERIRSLERRLVDIARGAADSKAKPLPTLQRDLASRWERSQVDESDRLLMTAAHTLPVTDIVALWRWLEHKERRREARNLVLDTVRSRSIGSVAALVEEFSKADLAKPASREHVACLALRYVGENRSLEEILELHARWTDSSGALRVRGWDDMFGAWMSGWRSTEERVRVFEVLAQDRDTNRDAWRNASKEVQRLSVDDVPAAELLLALGGRDDSPWARDIVREYFDRGSLVVPNEFWRTVQDSRNLWAQEAILREAGLSMTDNILPTATQYLWEDAEARGSEEFLARFLGHVIEASEEKAQRLLGRLKERDFGDTYDHEDQLQRAVQLLEALLYVRQEGA